MKLIRVGIAAVLGAVVAIVGTFVVLNAFGGLWYLAARPSDQGLDTRLFFFSLLASPVAGVAGGIIGAYVAARRGGEQPGRIAKNGAD